MNCTPVVSVIIPTHNRAHYLKEAIESVVAQTYQDWELIVVDDGSTDHTRAVVERCQAQDVRIRYVHQQNGGPAAARNRGIREARGAFVAFLDDDDLWLPEKLSKQVSQFQRNPSLGFVYAKSAMAQNGRYVAEWWPPRAYPNTFSTLFRLNIIPTLTVMVRKRCLDEVGGFDESLPVAQDYDLWLRLAQRYVFDWVPEALAVYRKHEANLSRDREGGNREAVYLDGIRIISRIPVSRRLGISRVDKAKRMAEEHIGLATLYQRQGRYAQATTQYARGLLAYPLVGLRFWGPETETWRFTAPYRILKPYAAMFLCGLRSLRRRANGSGSG